MDRCRGGPVAQGRLRMWRILSAGRGGPVGRQTRHHALGVQRDDGPTLPGGDRGRRADLRLGRPFRHLGGRVDRDRHGAGPGGGRSRSGTRLGDGTVSGALPQAARRPVPVQRDAGRPVGRPSADPDGAGVDSGEPPQPVTRGRDGREGQHEPAQLRPGLPPRGGHDSRPVRPAHTDSPRPRAAGDDRSADRSDSRPLWIRRPRDLLPLLRANPGTHPEGVPAPLPGHHAVRPRRPAPREDGSPV